MSAEKSAIARQVEKLRTRKLSEIERSVAAKRRRWVEGVASRFTDRRSTPRQAYELFMGEYLGLNLDNVPIVQESTDRIVWRSVNACPTLDACAELELDTRAVCRGAYEKSTQAFFSALDPTLRFHRCYDEIRPHAPHCLEWIVRLDFEAMMRVAIEEAQQSRAEGNKGYGAVVAFDGEIVSRAHDTAVIEHDPSLHAEVNAIRQACRVCGDANLSGAVLFSTCEPCPMCSSLAVWANVTTIVFGASIEETLAQGKDRITIPAEEVVARSPTMIEVIGGALSDECLSLYQR